MSDFQPQPLPNLDLTSPAPAASVPSSPVDLASTTARGLTPAARTATSAPSASPSLVQQALASAPNLSALLPDSLGQTLRVGQSAPAPRVVQSLPNNVTALQNKWSDPDVVAAIAQLPDRDRRALIDLDATRVAQGSQPLTKEQTILAAQTVRTGKPATAPSEGSILNVPGNILSNLGDMVKSIPRIPGALLKEASQLGTISSDYDNALANLLNSPGIRMIPGAYIAGQAARGTDGLETLAKNPLFTALDALPAASALAKTTPVVREAARLAELEGTTVRPLGVLATRALNDAGEVVPNRLGEVLQTARNDTRLGQAVDSAFGGRARDVARMQVRSEQRVAGLMSGLIDDGSPEVALARRSEQMVRKAAEYGWDQGKLADLAQRAQSGEAAALTGLGPEELAYINEARDLAAGYGNVMLDQKQLAKFFDPVSGTEQFYPSTQVRQFERQKVNVEHMERMADMRSRALSDPAELAKRPLTSDDVLGMLDQSYDPALSKAQRSAELRSLGAVLEAYGLDSRELLGGRVGRKRVMGSLDEAMSSAAAAGVSGRDAARAILDDALASPRQLLSMTDIIQQARSWRTAGGQVDTQVRDLSRAIAARDTKQIRAALNNLSGRTRFSSPTTEAAFRDTVQSLQRRFAHDDWMSERGGYQNVQARAERARRKFESAVSSTPPASFGPTLAARRDTLATTRATAAVEKQLARAVTPEEAGRVAAAIETTRWDALEPLGVPAKQLQKIYSSTEQEVAGTWRELAAAGVDPVFMHNVGLSRARGLATASVDVVPNSLSQVRERVLDASPGVQDLAVALNHQGMEILTRRASEEFVDHVTQKYGMRQADLQRMYEQQAYQLAASDPALSVRGHMQRLIDRSWERFNPQQAGYNWGGSRLEKYNQDAVFIPKALAKNLKQINEPARPITALFNKVTNTFRVAVVGLSPRTQLYNILGGATMMMGETGPAAFKYASRARELLRDPSLIESEALRATIGSAKRDILDLDGRGQGLGRAISRPEAQAHLLAGKTLGRMWNEVQEARSLGKVRDVFGQVTNKLLDLNGFFDDSYRVMAYLYGYDKQITKGLSRDVAERAGLEMANKVMMDWTSLTPFERSTIKAIFPFYGFMNHVARYVFRYPVDHPLRAAILGSFARSEVADAATLPHSFLSAFFFGGTDDSGNRKAVNLAPLNPFGDVANMMTFSGFLSATNPAISTVLESVGLVQGDAELYPTLRYDPESGRLSAAHGNPLLLFLENTIPQTSVLTAMLGVNNEFRDRMARDPAGATRYLTSTLGLPLPITDASSLVRSYNLTQEAAKAEVARQKSEADARNDALRTGDWTQALRYPGLQDDYQTLLSASPTQLAQYQPQGADIYAAMIEQAYARQTQTAQQNARVASGIDQFLPQAASQG